MTSRIALDLTGCAGVTRDKPDLMREVDAVYLGKIRKAGLYDEIWQAFSVLSTRGMTAD